MSEEFESTVENSYSSFWPIFILLLGLLIWAGYQDWATNTQRSLYNKQFQATIPTINEAQNVKTRYIALMKDLVDTSQKDPAAADIVKAAIAAGLIQVQKNDTNSAANPVAPAAAK